jgi:hypothetical protein
MFLQIKEQLRLHPDWDDEQIAERVGLKYFELDLITTARRDLEAG